MAIWQYKLIILPKDDLNELNVATHLSADAYDNFAFWRQYDYTVEFFRPITSLFDIKESWSKAIKLYGSEDSTCVEIFMDNGFISDVSVRIDFRTNYLSVLNELLEFCSLNGLALLDENLDLLPLNETTVQFMISNSHQRQTLRHFQDNS